MEYSVEKLCARIIKVKELCAKKIKAGFIKAKTIEANEINSENINVKNISLGGTNISCLLLAPAISNTNPQYDCMDCNITEDFPYGHPIKPDFLSQDVWDYLECNREAYRQQLHDEFLEGREQIRCIKNAYGCTICPPDCMPVEGCTGPCPDPPNCTVDPGCIPDATTCSLDVPLYLYATQTVAPYYYTECEGTQILRYIDSQTFSLNVNNVSCTISPRVATVFVQYAYLNNGNTGTTGTTGSFCIPCSSEPPVPGLECNCNSWNGPSISCGIVDVVCKQFEATININIGEKFNGSVILNSNVINRIYQITRNLSQEEGQFPAAVQLCIFLEEGLEIKKIITRQTDPNEVDTQTDYVPSVSHSVA